MGRSDRDLIPRYSEAISNYINNVASPGFKIAWLGQKVPFLTDQNDIFYSVHDKIKAYNVEHHFYDIENSNKVDHNSYKWDINKTWKQIFGYDLVIGLRVSYLSRSSEKFITNLKLSTKNNARVIFDFVSSEHPNKLGNGNYIYEGVGNFKLSTEMLRKKNLYFGNYRALSESTKNRHYTIAEIIRR